MSILKTLFSTVEPAADAELALDEKSAFDAANAAIDRAIAERQASEAADEERRFNEPNRRKGGSDTRPPGSAERRGSPQPSFGRRRTLD